MAVERGRGYLANVAEKMLEERDRVNTGVQQEATGIGREHFQLEGERFPDGAAVEGAAGGGEVRAVAEVLGHGDDTVGREFIQDQRRRGGGRFDTLPRAGRNGAHSEGSGQAFQHRPAQLFKRGASADNPEPDRGRSQER